jgi:hypothetical protein
MPRLVACPACGVHVRIDDARCHACDAALRDEKGVVARSPAAVLMGLALAACGGDDGSPNTSIEPEYGVPATESVSVSDTDTGSSGSSDSFEPEYGVPQTDDDTTGADTSGTDTGGTDTGGTTGDTDPGSTSLQPDYGVAELD